MEGTYTGSPLGDVLISDGDELLTADDPVIPQAMRPHLPNRNPLNRQQRQRELLSCEGPRVSDPTMFKQGGASLQIAGTGGTWR